VQSDEMCYNMMKLGNWQIRALNIQARPKPFHNADTSTPDHPAKKIIKNYNEEISHCQTKEQISSFKEREQFI
jgi:hypothetical protein